MSVVASNAARTTGVETYPPPSGPAGHGSLTSEGIAGVSPGLFSSGPAPRATSAIAVDITRIALTKTNVTNCILSVIQLRFFIASSSVIQKFLDLGANRTQNMSHVLTRESAPTVCALLCSRARGSAAKVFETRHLVPKSDFHFPPILRVWTLG